jgi:ubiquinone/menaquinone biosynthesis C-methylase UbiE
MEPENKNLELMSGADNYNRWIYNNLKDDLGERIVEIGSGIGNMTSFLLGRELVVGTEISSPNIRKLKKKFSKQKNFKIKNYNIENEFTELKKHRPDTVLCINVLEHIKDDSKALKNMYRVLEKKGKLLLLVPASKLIYGTVDKADGHYRRYNKKELRMKLKDANFKILKERYMNLPGMIGWFYHGKILKIKIHKKNDLSLFNKLAPIFEFIEKRIPPPAGLSLIMVCKK